MLHHRGKCLVVFLVLITGIRAQAQTSSISNPLNGRENNPYSKYGIGEMVNGNNVILRGMGNVTSAYAHPFSINSDNPASYAFLRRTTFEGAGTGSTRHITNGTDNYNTGTATLSYLNIGFPVGNNAGLCLGFRPYSTMYYSLTDTILSTSIDSVTRFYGGEGSLTLPYIGGAYKYKGLSIGVNVGYLFGTLRSTAALRPAKDTGINKGYTAEFSNYNRIGGIYWKSGLMYERKMDSGRYTFRIGGTFALNQDLVERNSIYRVSHYNFTDTAVHDTVYNSGERRGKLTMPTSYSVGINFGKTDKWNIGIDYAGTQWSTFNSVPDSSLLIGVGTSSYKISIGGEYTPDMNSIRNYFARVTYRLGGYYGKDYLRVNNSDIPYYGLTAGLSLPFRRSISRLHTSVDVGRMGLLSNGLIQQTYVRFSVGVSFNDIWFVKRKYE
ncbi:MAG: hypothetical protein V4649_07950 [Bacteroidota bacterium]